MFRDAIFDMLDAQITALVKLVVDQRRRLRDLGALEAYAASVSEEPSLVQDVGPDKVTEQLGVFRNLRRVVPSRDCPHSGPMMRSCASSTSNLESVWPLSTPRTTPTTSRS
mmetsp:Transcript_152592/g.489330  ORF Transcript_152592/g.489330 Transcript_152592/m.489330 type:complete len:111 (-) Transcript_152592:213-545(-)